MRAVAVVTMLLAVFGLAPGAQTGPKVLLLYDMEGVTGAVKPQDVNFGSDSYPATRESLTEDVNAAIRGFLKAGASEVVLTDGHGSGNPDPDYLLDRLPRGARFDVREAPYDPYIEAMDGSYAVMAAIAMHGRAGGQAFLAHTYNGHTRWQMGGHDMNESMLVAASLARFDLPLVLVTGDDVLRDEVRAFSPATEYVVVKKAVSVEAAEARPRDEVSRDIEAAAERALRNRSRVTPWRPRELAGGEFENRFSYTLPPMASLAVVFPRAYAVDDKTIGLKTATFLDAYLAFRALAAFTGQVGGSLMIGWLRETPGGPETIRKLQERLPGRLERSFTPTSPELARTVGPGRHGFR